jgi:hypothetical protein
MDERGALDLLQTLIGGGQGASAAQTQTPTAQDDEMMGAQLGGLGGHSSSSQPNQSGDLLGSLLGGLGGAGQQPGSQAPAPGGDLLGSLLGGLMGAGNSGGQAAGSQSGLDMNDLVTAAMAFMQAKQSGGSTQQALVQAFVAGSGMGRAPHREQSTELVVNSFLQALARGG